MADPKPFHLRNIDIENLDLSKFEGDHSPEELAAVRQALIATRNEHVANYESLPLLDKAGIYAQEKFGDLTDYVSENPEKAVLGPLAVLGAKAVADKGRAIYGSLREKMAAPLPDDGLLAHQLKEQNKSVNKIETPAPVSQETPPTQVSADKTPDQIRREKLFQAQTQLNAKQAAPVTATTATTLQPLTSPETPTVELNTKINNEPKDMGIVKKGKQNTLSNEMAETRKQEFGSISDGMRNTYNKNKSNPLGPGAYNWMAGQEGPKAPEVWKNLVGNKNMSYDEFQKNIKPIYEGYIGGYGDPDPFAQVAKRGAYRTPSRIPENIKGNASLGGMGSLAVMAAALGLGGSEKGQAAMAKAAKAIKDIGFSPDILTNKAEEMGRLGTGYVTAGNPVYRRELEQKLQSTNDPQYKKVLEEELAKISSSSNSPYRSVPPPR